VQNTEEMLEETSSTHAGAKQLANHGHGGNWGDDIGQHQPRMSSLHELSACCLMVLQHSYWHAGPRPYLRLWQSTWSPVSLLDTGLGTHQYTRKWQILM
jgi:hypothetical protein